MNTIRPIQQYYDEKEPEYKIRATWSLAWGLFWKMFIISLILYVPLLLIGLMISFSS